MKPSLNLGILVALGVCAIWGETFVSSKILLEAGLLPSDIFFMRFLIAYLSMWIFSHKRLMADTLVDECLLLLLGFTGGTLYFLSENMALMYSTASNVAILVGTTPLVTALFLSLFYREERMKGKQLMGSVLAFLGMTLVILNGQLVLHLSPKGDMLALVASLTWGVYSLVIKGLSARYNSLFITRKVFGYGLFTILPYMLLSAPLNTDVELLMRPQVWANILYLGLIASLLCFFAWNWALTQLGTIRATNILYLQSLFTMFFSSLILGERITLMALTGTALLILGMAWATRKTKKEKEIF